MFVYEKGVVSDDILIIYEFLHKKKLDWEHMNFFSINYRLEARRRKLLTLPELCVVMPLSSSIYVWLLNATKGYTHGGATSYSIRKVTRF